MNPAEELAKKFWELYYERWIKLYPDIGEYQGWENLDMQTKQVTIRVFEAMIEYKVFILNEE